MGEYLQRLYDKIAEDYPKQVLKWAYKRANSVTEAEDLAQEVMFQVLQSVKKEVERGLEIEKLDNFIRFAQSLSGVRFGMAFKPRIFQKRNQQI
jgi:hypothetical protein